MVFSCPNCATALTYDPVTKKMVCKACGSMFEASQLQERVGAEEHFEGPEGGNTSATGWDNAAANGWEGSNAAASKWEIKDASTDRWEALPENPVKKMQARIYTCSACGAEVILNDVEAATFCIYCGQPTVVFSRVSEEAEPDYIIPFKISGEVAKTVIRHRLKKFFVPRKVKKTVLNNVRGIYVPYWLYDMEYHDKQYHYIEEKALGGAAYKKKGVFQEGKCLFQKITVGASRKLMPLELQYVEPFDMKQAVPFQPAYLSGFYADKYGYDAKDQVSLNVAAWKAMECYNNEMERIFRKNWECTQVINWYRCPEATIKKTSYALLPIWFANYQYDGKTYSILVNGQTGKMAASIPPDKIKTGIVFWLSFLLFGCLGALMGRLMFTDVEEGLMVTQITYFILGIAGGNFIPWIMGGFLGKSYKEGLEFAKSDDVREFVQNRQEV